MKMFEAKLEFVPWLYCNPCSVCVSDVPGAHVGLYVYKCFSQLAILIPKFYSIFVLASLVC